MEQKSFTTREWILFIFLVSLLQGFIWYAAFVNSANSSALNYISFAGTLISIILAVLAIGYTYGESISEKNKSNALSNQIETLNNVLNNLTIQSSSLEEISAINSDLLKLSNNLKDGINHTQQRVEDVKISLDNFIDQTTTVNKITLTSEEQDTIIKAIGSSKSYSVQIPAMFLLYFQRTGFINNREVEKTKSIFEEANKKCEELDLEPIEEMLYFGSIVTLREILLQNNLYDEKDGNVTINSKLLVVIEKWLTYNSTKEKKNYNDVLFEVLLETINSQT